MIKIHSVSEMAVSDVLDCVREIESGVTVNTVRPRAMTFFGDSGARAACLSRSSCWRIMIAASGVLNSRVTGFQMMGFSQLTMFNLPPGCSLPVMDLNAGPIPTNPPIVASTAKTTSGTHIDGGDSCGMCAPCSWPCSCVTVSRNVMRNVFVNWSNVLAGVVSRTISSG